MVREYIIIQAETFRILRSEDGRNWILQVWKKGGINPRTGQLAKGHWDNEGHYGKLRDLTIYLISSQMEVPEGTLQGQFKDLITELRRVEKLVTEQLEKAVAYDPS